MVAVVLAGCLGQVAARKNKFCDGLGLGQHVTVASYLAKVAKGAVSSRSLNSKADV